MFRERSWDFIPPDIVRPFAFTTLGHIAVLVNRLGMSWETFRPEDGVIRAEGNGHVISSNLVRSVGIVLNYKNLGASSQEPLLPGLENFSTQEMYIPLREADLMGFGILTGLDVLSVPAFKIGTFE